MPTRRRGQLVLVTTKLIRDNPVYADYLRNKIGHYVTAINGSVRSSLYHYPQHCSTCGGG